MAKVSCEIEETTLVNDNDQDVDSVRAVCSRCDHETESFGTGDASVRRCLVIMREECPKKENNYYYVADKGGGRAN